MARYYFHLRDGEDITADPEGREFDTVEAMVAATLREARSIISHEAMAGRIKLHQRIDVETEAGKVVHSLDFAEAVTIELHLSQRQGKAD